MNRGLLVAVEGLDGSGKTTQIELVRYWLEVQGISVVYTRRRESRLLRKTIRRFKDEHAFTPLTYCLLHLADFADRYETIVRPALEAGQVVLVDKYLFTSLVRDAARGLDRAWVLRMYGFAPDPDLTVFLDLPPKAALARMKRARTLEYYDAGMDLDLAEDPSRSFLLFQQRIVKEYAALGKRHRFLRLDASLAIPTLQKKIRAVVAQSVRRKFRIRMRV